MFRFLGSIFRLCVIGAVLLAVVFAVIGVNRIEAAYLSVRDYLRSNVDDLVDTRVALRHEIGKLRDEYPSRIADLRCQLREIERDLSACEADQRLCAEVVALCESDAAVLESKLALVDAGADGHLSSTVEFRSERLGRAEALARAGRIAKTAESYRNRGQDLAREHQLLRGERSQVGEELASMEREFREFQTEMGTMLREIDAVERKEELVEMVERQRGGDDTGLSNRADALTAIRDRIQRRKIELEEKLSALRTTGPDAEYEARARLQLRNASVE